MKVWKMKLNNENQCKQTTKVPNITEDIYIKNKEQQNKQRNKQKEHFSYRTQIMCLGNLYGSC